MRRRARETFVLGAERVFDEAELDLRNEAEADHEPTIELDHAAPAEPAIAPQAPPTGSPAGAEATRGRRPSGVARKPRRPRPSVVPVLVGGAAAAGLAFALVRGGAAEEASERTLADASAASVSRKHMPAAVTDRRATRARRVAPAPDPEPRGHGLGAAEPKQKGPPAPVEATMDPPAPVASHAAPAVSTVSGDPAGPASTAVASSDPAQSASSVRQEFGP